MLAGTALVSLVISEAEDLRNGHSRDDFWNTLSEKPEPLYQCEGMHGGNKVTMPSPPDCDIPVKAETNKVVRAYLFLPDVRKQIVKVNLTNPHLF